MQETFWHYFIAEYWSGRWITYISHLLYYTRSMNGPRWFSASDWVEKNRLVKKVLLENEGQKQTGVQRSTIKESVQ